MRFLLVREAIIMFENPLLLANEALGKFISLEFLLLIISIKSDKAETFVRWDHACKEARQVQIFFQLFRLIIAFHSKICFMFF